MKRISALILSLILAVGLFSCAAPAPTRTKDVAVIYTNDVHVALDKNIGYAGLAAFKNELIADGAEVLLVDAGDSVQGAPLGGLSNGKLPIDIMNELGYSASAVGNHEFDYNVETLNALAERAKFPFLSVNFVDATTKNPIFKPYVIEERDGVKIAFVGVSTPLTPNTSNPTFFQDEAGKDKYTFLPGEDGMVLWAAVQQAVNSARQAGAQIVVALTHLGIDAVAAPYISPNLIANTTGIDVVLDGHSHSVIQCERVKNKDGDRVLLSSTGSELANIGYLLIDKRGNISTGLVNNYTAKDAHIDEFIKKEQSAFDEVLKQSVVSLQNDMIIADPVTGVRIVRNAETNLGDLCADAIRAATNADVAVQIGGAIRAKLPMGEITFGDLLGVMPSSYPICKLSVTGQQLLDALEFSVSSSPKEFGGFCQVSGLTFAFHTDIPSPVQRDESGMYIGITGERRVHDVLIGSQPLVPDNRYTLAGIAHTLLEGGDGYTMFSYKDVVENPIILDHEAMKNYFSNGYAENAALYEAPYGEGRIVAVP
ncbi:MAG: bifunctional UDP-sugar hydrolase/5'-nucleotidase [Oscillospiraceae bacterium]